MLLWRECVVKNNGWRVKAYGSEYQEESIRYASIVPQKADQRIIFNVWNSGEEVDAIKEYEDGG